MGIGTLRRYREAGMKPPAEGAPGDESVDFKKMTKAQLLEYVDEHGVDLGAAKTKADMVEAITAASAEPDSNPDGGQESEPAVDAPGDGDNSDVEEAAE